MTLIQKSSDLSASEDDVHAPYVPSYSEKDEGATMRPHVLVLLPVILLVLVVIMGGLNLHVTHQTFYSTKILV